MLLLITAPIAMRYCARPGRALTAFMMTMVASFTIGTSIEL
jgi:hypothetical protein